MDIKNKICTTDGKPPRDGYEYGKSGAPAPIQESTGQHEAYWVLCDYERAKGFVRPVRDSYRHMKCGTDTHMGRALAETYARDPKFYGATFCCYCGNHFNLQTAYGPQFFWVVDGVQTQDVVGE